jgi:YD repeat-containing protein
VPRHDYTGYSTANIVRGNATKVKKWRNTDGAFLTTTYNYDDLGNIRSISDPLGHATTWSYSDNWSGSSCLPSSNSKAYVTQVTNHLGHNIILKRLPCTGQLQSRKDPNNQETTFTYDLLNRPDLTYFPDGGHTDIDYNDSARWVLTKVLQAGSTEVASRSKYDALGRTWRSERCEDGTTCAQTIKTDTTYDALSRVSTTTNPYRSAPSSTDGTTTTQYDALGRVTKVIKSDSNFAETQYSGNQTIAIDEAGRKRKSISDALGRLTSVWETDPNNSNSFLYETVYSYDVLGNLLSVNQKGNDANTANWRTRTFTYNSLSQC